MKEMSNLFNLPKETGSIYSFEYIAECHRKRLIKTRNNMGAYESVRKLVAFPYDVMVDNHHRSGLPVMKYHRSDSH
jgi:hypothetical protein